MKGLELPSDGHACDTDTLHLLYALVRYYKPSIIVEAGTYMGSAACVMGQAMKDLGLDGQVWTADIKDYGAAGVVEKNGLQDYVTIYQGDFLDMLNGHLMHHNFRMAFIDSGLTNDDTAVMTNVRFTHAEAAFERLKKGGVLVVDDMTGQWDGVETIKGHAGINLLTGRGLSLVQKR